MVQITGAGVALNPPDFGWCRQHTTFAFECPDGVSRCVTVPNWKRNIWRMPVSDDALFRYIANAWKYARIFARYYPDARVFADKLCRDIDLDYRQSYYSSDNDNFTPSIFDAIEGITTERPRWGKGGLASVFKRHA